MASPRRLVIAGLGNWTHPNTRHSIGQLLLQNLALYASSLPTSTGSPHLTLHKTHPAQLTTIVLSPPTPSSPPLELLFCLPRRLMNISGPAVVSSARAFLPSPLDANRILTIQDDLDLAPGTIQLRKGGSAKGHNGVKSFEKALGGEKGFWRLRVGIGRPEKEEVSGVRGQGVADFVLGPLSREEVHSCQWEDGKSGVLLEKVWKEVLRVGWAEEGDEVLAVQKKK